MQTHMEAEAKGVAPVYLVVGLSAISISVRNVSFCARNRAQGIGQRNISSRGTNRLQN